VQVNYADPTVKAVLVHEFVNQVLPGKDFFRTGKEGGENSTFMQTLSAITKNHYMLTMFQQGSMHPSRVIRWLLVSHGVLVALFFDTLFYSIFFPTDSE